MPVKAKSKVDNDSAQDSTITTGIEDDKNTFLVEQYHVLSNRQICYVQLYRNFPILFFTVQSFLCSLGLGVFTNLPIVKLIAAFLGFFFGILCIREYNELRDHTVAEAELLVDIETFFSRLDYKSLILHANIRNQRTLDEKLVSQILCSKGYRKVTNNNSFTYWLNGMYVLMVFNVCLFFNTLFSSFTYEFLWFPSYYDFLRCLDKSAIGIICLIIAINWITHVFYSIKTGQFAVVFEKARLLLKILYSFEFEIILFSITYSVLSSRFYQVYPSIKGIWYYVFLLCLLAYIVIYIQIYISYKKTIKDRKQTLL